MQNAERTLFDNVSVASAARRPSGWWICLESEANTEISPILPFRDAHDSGKGAARRSGPFN